MTSASKYDIIEAEFETLKQVQKGSLKMENEVRLPLMAANVVNSLLNAIVRAEYLLPDDLMEVILHVDKEIESTHPQDKAVKAILLGFKAHCTSILDEYNAPDDSVEVEGIDPANELDKEELKRIDNSLIEGERNLYY